MTRTEKEFGDRSNDDIIREILRACASRENPIGRKEIIKYVKEMGYVDEKKEPKIKRTAIEGFAYRMGVRAYETEEECDEIIRECRVTEREILFVKKGQDGRTIGYWMMETLSETEWMFLMDSVLNSKILTKKEADNLANRITFLAGKSFSDLTNYRHRMGNQPYFVGIIGEICISDDPEYVTGYVSSKEIGYRRITKMKRMGSEKGGRIFLFRGTDAEEQKAIDFLQNQHVIVRNVPKKICKKSDMKRPQKWDKIDKALVSLKENHLFRTMKTIESAQSSHVTIDGKDYVLMASNNYLDIASHPSIKSAVVESTAMYGFGSGGSRLTTGNTVIHNALENKIASYKETEAAIVFNTGYVANVATISAMVKKGDTVFSDELNHASIIDGCRLSKAKIVTYAHNDMDDLRKKIQENPCETGIVVSDAVFSMDGDILKLPEFLDICEENQLFSMVDEAHSTGVIGKTGHGIREYWQEKRQVDILMGTFSKSIGGEGGYVAGETRLINYLRNVARGFIFSTSLSPVTMAANLAGIEVLEKEISRVTKLQYNVKYFCTQLGKYGINVKSETAIIPVIIGDEENALTVSNYLHENGYFISAIRYPTVAKGAARLRVALMSSHTEAELKKCAELIGKALLMK